MMVEHCALCGQEKKLQKSHLIPRFVGKWLKETSATGFMTTVANPDERVQDLPTLPLLCSECEQLFSRSETYFSKTIFLPFHKRRIRSFQYDEQLQRFVVSLSWRTLKLSYEEFAKEMPHLRQVADQAERDWRDFLLGKRASIVPYENHVFFLDHLEGGTNIPQGFMWYTLRSTDATLASNKSRVFAYTKLPWMIFITSIHPKSIEGLKGTRISDKGTLSMPQYIDDAQLGGFLLHRVELTSSPKTSADLSQRRFRSAISKNPKRFIESETFEIMIAERDLLRKQKILGMPESVKELVEIIVEAVDNPSLDKMQNRIRRYQSRTIAEALCKLSREEALSLHELITSTVKISAMLDDEGECTLEAGPVWITFMIFRGTSKEEQRTKAMAALEKLEKKRGRSKTPLAVFSMNANDGSFESAFFVN